MSRCVTDKPQKLLIMNLIMWKNKLSISFFLFRFYRTLGHNYNIRLKSIKTEHGK